MRVHLKMPSAKQEQVDPNYLVIGRDGKTMTLVLGEFKTRRDERTPKYSHVLPPLLCETIAASLAHQPRKYLLVQPRFGDPFPSANAYTKYANKVLKRVLGNPGVSTSSLRHSFLTSLPARLKLGARRELARLMMHSPERAMSYVYHFEEGEGDFDVASMGISA